MRPGCIGCFLLFVAVAFVAVLAGGFFFMTGNIMDEPQREVLRWSPAEGSMARAKLYEVAQRDAGQSTRQDPLILTEREVTALVSRHLAETAGLRFEPFAIKLVRGQFVLQGRTVLRSLLQGPPFAQLIPYLPPAQLDRLIWITVRGYLSLQPGAQGGKPGRGRVVLTEFNLGKQTVGNWPFSAVMGPAGSRLFDWPVPGGVRDVEIEDGRIVIRTR